MEFTAQQIAQMIGGRVEGNPDAVVNSFAKIEEGKPGAISFLSNAKYTHYIYDTESSVVLVDESLALEHEVKATLIRVKSAYEAVARLLQAYDSMKPKKQGIDPLAFIAPSAEVGEGCYVGAFAYIGEGAKVGKGCQIYPHAVVCEKVTIGDDCILYPNAVVYHDCRLGSRVTLHAGSVIGADGFGFAPTPQGYDKIPQIGIVTIDDDVEIGANTCVDRSTMGSRLYEGWPVVHVRWTGGHSRSHLHWRSRQPRSSVGSAQQHRVEPDAHWYSAYEYPRLLQVTSHLPAASRTLQANSATTEGNRCLERRSIKCSKKVIVCP